jgi:hypothetical protein
MDSLTGPVHVTPAPTADSPVAWDDVVRIALSARKNGATPAEVARVAKTLARLGAAAMAATVPSDAAGASGQTSPESFADVLARLAHG